MDVFESLSEDVSNNNCGQKLKAIPFYTRGLENMVILFHAAQYMMTAQNTYIVHKFSSVIKFFILLAQNLPAHATDQRY